MAKWQEMRAAPRHRRGTYPLPAADGDDDADLARARDVIAALRGTGSSSLPRFVELTKRGRQAALARFFRTKRPESP